MSAQVFASIVGHLNRRRIAYMLVGSFASTFFGASRTTLDIDIVIEATSAEISS